MASSVMRKVSTRNLLAHKVRLLLTVFSVVLGTSFVAAAVIFTSTVSAAFDSVFDNVSKGVSVQVSAKEANDSPGVPVELVNKLESEKAGLGIDRMVANYGGPVTVADSSGKPIQSGGAPSVAGAYIPTDREVDTSMKIVEGRAPSGPNEISINKAAAEKGGLSIGSKTKVVLGTGVSEPIDVTVVGLTDVTTSTGGFVGVQFDEATARDYFSDGDYVQSVDFKAAPGISDTQLRDGIHQALGSPEAVDELYLVRTGEQIRDDQKAEIDEFLTIFRYVLLAFAAIGLLVGTFIIYNTFSMIVAQRNRELALLRAIGASRSDVSRSVLREAFIVGVLGGAIGLGLGVAIAAGMLEFTKSQGMPANGLQVGVAAIVSAVFVGVVVTMLSAWIPARRASSIPPVEAMRESTVEPGAGSLRTRTIIGAIVGVLGVAALVTGGLGEGSGAAATVAAGALLAVIAVVLGAPALSQPLISGVGKIFEKPFGTIGRLARTNAVRNPRRSAATAFALTLGLMLVVVIGTLGSSFKGTINSAVDKGVTADYIITGTNNGQLPMAVDAAVRTAPEAKTVVAQAIAIGTVNGKQLWMSAPLGGSMSNVVTLKTTEGTVDVPDDGIAIDRTTASERGWKVGDSITIRSVVGKDVPVRVVGVFEPNEISGPALAGKAVFEQLVPVETLRVAIAIWVKGDGGNLGKLRSELEDATGRFLIAQVQTRDEFKSSISSQIDQMMVTLYAMLGLSLIIAILGIINTLALSVVERKREIGMLRAIGMSRPQVRRTIYLESTYIAVFGALLGVLLGLAIGVPLVRTLAYWGLEGVVIPWTLIGGTLIGGAVVGVIAALWPAITAARTRPLEAIVES